jgi:hypothetical protein
LNDVSLLSKLDLEIIYHMRISMKTMANKEIIIIKPTFILSFHFLVGKKHYLHLQRDS